MGTTNSNFLPSTTGLNLGSTVQRWNGFFQNLNVLSQGVSIVPFSPTPLFNGLLGNVFEITLTAIVSSSTVSNLVSGYVYTFIIIQDGIGNHTFAWPVGIKGAMVVDGTPSITNVQSFIYDGTTLFATSAGVSM